MNKKIGLATLLGITLFSVTGGSAEIPRVDCSVFSAEVKHGSPTERKFFMDIDLNANISQQSTILLVEERPMKIRLLFLREDEKFLMFVSDAESKILQSSFEGGFDKDGRAALSFRAGLSKEAGFDLECFLRK